MVRAISSKSIARLPISRLPFFTAAEKMGWQTEREYQRTKSTDGGIVFPRPRPEWN